MLLKLLVVELHRNKNPLARAPAYKAGASEGVSVLYENELCFGFMSRETLVVCLRLLAERRLRDECSFSRI